MVVLRLAWGRVVVCLLGCGCGGVTVDIDGGDGGTADAPWWSNFDAQYDPAHPPLPGTFPPSDNQLCGAFVDGSGYVNGCIDARYPRAASCVRPTGWCCSGKITTGKCMCGWTLGCVGPQVCCAKPGDTVPRCEADTNACVGAGGVPWGG